MRVFAILLVALPLAAALSAQDPSSASEELQHVVMVDGNQSLQMKENTASRKGDWGVLVSKQYYVFKGPKAALRAKTTQPVFQFEAEPSSESPVYLFRLDRHSDRREIRIARGSGLVPLSLPQDHIIATRLEEIGAGGNSTKRYQLKPIMPLNPGEYCLSRSLWLCFDFGVD